MREPPATLIVGGTVRLWDVAIDIDRRELHALLVVERIGGIAAVAGGVQAITIGAWRNVEAIVLCQPNIVVDILHEYAQLSAIISCQMM